MAKDPKKDNPPAIQGGGHKDAKGSYAAKHTNLGVGTSRSSGYTGKHVKDADVEDLDEKRKKK